MDVLDGGLTGGHDESWRGVFGQNGHPPQLDVEELTPALGQVEGAAFTELRRKRRRRRGIRNATNASQFAAARRASTWQSTVPPRLSAAGACSSSHVPPLSKVMTDRMLSSLTEPLTRVATKTPRSPSTRCRSANGSLAKYLRAGGETTFGREAVATCGGYVQWRSAP